MLHKHYYVILEFDHPAQNFYAPALNPTLIPRTAEDKMEKRKLKKRAKRKKMADAEKTLKKKNTKVSATGGGGASLPAHVTNG